MLRIKVCGLSDAANAKEILSLQPDFFGLNFYSQSPRFVFSEAKAWRFIKDFPESIPTGVFVNADRDFIFKKKEEYFLRAIQLHGSESPGLCDELKKKNLIVIKTFSISGKKDFEAIEQFQNKIDFCLFDTKTKLFGGSGTQFDWSLLKNYDSGIPFFLSGGISSDDIEEIKSVMNPMFYGIDINSKFELQPGKKDFTKIKKFIHDIHSTFSYSA